MPGHKAGRGAPASGIALLGRAAYEADFSELGGFDYLHGPRSALVEAQAEAAELLGAAQTWFLVNGATVGNLAAILATVERGGEVLVARGSHRSVYGAILLSGAQPTYLPPVRNDRLDGLFGLDPRDVEAELTRNRQIRAVHVTTPSMYGFTIALEEIAEITAAHGVPLIVDEAHGTHFALHPAFPTTGLACGADIVIHSPHKTLGALTQAALLHYQGDRVDPTALDGMLQLLQSSSPSALLLISLAAAIHEMATDGREQWERVLALAGRVRESLASDPRLVVYDAEIVDSAGIAGFDPVKVVVDVDRLGISGYDASRWLRSHHGLNPEAADLRRLVFTLTPADTADTVDLLLGALRHLSADARELNGHRTIASLWPHHVPEVSLTPQRAAGGPHVAVPLVDAVGSIAGEMVIPYPPGIPLLVTGELISAEVVAAIQQLMAAGCRLVGMSDPTGTTIRCLDREHGPRPPLPPRLAGVAGARAGDIGG